MTEQGSRKDPYYPQLEIIYNQLGPSVYPELPSQTVDFLRKIRGRRILELAAGDGRATELLLEKNPFVITSDVKEVALKSMRSRLSQQRGSNHHVIALDAIGDTTYIPLADQSVDTIVSINFFYVYPPQILGNRVYPELARVLAGGGSVYFDFITEARREKPSGETVSFDVDYTFESGMKTIHTLAAYGFEVATKEFTLDQPPTPKIDYRLTGKAILASARKS